MRTCTTTILSIKPLEPSATQGSRDLEEAEAIRRLKQGDVSGLEELVRRHSVRALRTAFLMTRDRSAAEDIVQSAFLRVFERIEQFDVGRPFEPWFIRIIINDAQMLERRSRHIPLDLATESEQLPDSFHEPAIDEMLIANETNEVIWEAIGRLSARQRAVIVMRYYLGMGEDEMATELDCAPGTVKSRLHAARQRLRQLLPASE